MTELLFVIFICFATIKRLFPVWCGVVFTVIMFAVHYLLDISLIPVMVLVYVAIPVVNHFRRSSHPME